VQSMYRAGSIFERLVRRIWALQFIRYSTMAGVGLLVHGVTLYLFLFFFEVDRFWANLPATTLGMLSEFPLHYLISFPEKEEKWWYALAKFVAPRPLTAILAQVVYGILLLPFDALARLVVPRFLWAVPFGASFVGLVLAFIINYLYNRRFAFRKTGLPKI
jgi:putative flippase GtrA